MRERGAWLVAGVLAVYTIAAVAAEVAGGPLDPPGPPSATHHSLALVPPSWMQVLRASDGSDVCDSSRFTCVMEAEAVLDNETGLVWQRTPSQNINVWINAVDLCRSTEIAQRRGWRLPTLNEMQTLMDDAGDTGLPVGHPFVHNMTTVGNSVFWTSTKWTTEDPVSAWVANPSYSLSQSTDTFRSWCVRGAGGSDEEYSFTP
jgi:hypothetical protein